MSSEPEPPTPAEPDPLLSVIIPTLNEEATLPRLLKDLSRLKVPHEVIVVDGASADSTVEIAGNAGAKVEQTAPGRGGQLRRGAELAAADLLVFLHADVRLPPPAASAVEALSKNPPSSAYAFAFRIGSPRRVFRVLEAGTRLRGRILQLPYGDQGLVVPKAIYWAAGGHPAIPLMEDVELNRRLARTVGLEVLDEPVVISPRRWERDGPLRRSLTNLALAARYFSGASPASLAAKYHSEQDRP